MWNLDLHCWRDHCGQEPLIIAAGIGHLWGGNDRESLHNTIRILLADFGDQQGAHACTCSASQRVAELKALKAITSFSLLANNIEHGVNQFSALRVMPLRPIV